MTYGKDNVTLEIDREEMKIGTHIAAGDEFTGTLKCKTGILVSGVIRGDVACESGAIVIEKGGLVTGSLTGAEQILVDGRVGESEDAQTKITTPGLVALFDSAVVNGTIEYGKLATYGDMTHNGTSRKRSTS